MMSSDADAYASYKLDHHGLVAGMVDELGLVGKIDAMIPQDLGQRQVFVGTAVKAMILIGLGFVQRALYLTPGFFRGKPVGRLLGPGITAEMLNDDALGRALDAIFAFGVEAFYFLLASGVAKQLGLSGAGGHLDSTSFHVDSQYNSGDGSAAEGVVHIRQGYSRDHRPDLNQVVLQRVVENQAGIPLLMAVAGGNVNDQAGFHGLIQRHKAQLEDGGLLRYLVADSALYTEKSLRELGGTAWVSRVPETFAAACEVVQAVAGDLAESGEETVHRSLCVTEAGVRQRWLVVHSRAARCRAEKTLAKRRLQQGEAEMKAFDRLRREAFGKTLKLTQVHEGRAVQQTTPAKQRRPAGNQEASPARCAIEGHLASRTDVHARQLLQKSCFVVATNDTDGAVTLRFVPTICLLRHCLNLEFRRKSMANFIYSLPMVGLCTVILLVSIGVAIIVLLLTKWSKRKWPILSDLEANDTFFNAAGLIFSLLLAFITVSVWENYQDTVNAVESEASTLNNLYQDMDPLPDKERDQIRSLLRDYVRQVVDREWSLMGAGKSDPKAAQLLVNISNQIFSIKPQTESEKIMVRVLFEDIDKCRSFRMKRLLAITPALDTLMWSILILGTSVYLVYGCLIEIQHIRRHVLMVVLLSLTVGLVFILVAAYDRPFSRPLHFEPDAFIDLSQFWESHTGSVPIDHQE